MSKERIVASEVCLPEVTKVVMDIASISPVVTKDGVYYIANCNIQSIMFDGKWKVSYEAKRLRLSEYIYKVAGHLMLPGNGFVVTKEIRVKNKTTYSIINNDVVTNYYHNDNDECIIDMVQFTGTEGIKLPKAVELKYVMMSMEAFKINSKRIEVVHSANISNTEEF